MSDYPPGQPLDYVRPPSSALVQLKIAAIITIVAVSLAWIWSIIDSGGRLMVVFGAVPMPQAGPNVAPGTANTLFYVFLVLDVINIFLIPIVIFGAIQILRRKMYGFVRITSILSMLPIAAHCCCVLTLPMGAWLLTLLNKPEVKDAFLGLPADSTGPNSPYP